MESRSNKIILASKSPRRHELLKAMGYQFEVVDLDADENFPPCMAPEDICVHISENKARAYTGNIEYVVITADTIVALNGEILGKPTDRADAIRILTKLSGQTHQVFTGVTLRTQNDMISFADKTDVKFRSVSQEEIELYIDQHQPYDKAGSYGVQDWWGLTVVSKLVGSYTNVMGLPTEKLYQALSRL